MATRQITLDYDGEPVTFTVEGDVTIGPPDVLLDADDDLTKGRPWAADGFTVAPFLMPDEEGVQESALAVTRLALAEEPQP